MAHPDDSSCFLYSVPAAVSNPSCVSTSGGYGVILNWSCPSGGFDIFEVEVGGQQRNQSFCGTGMSVSDLGPAQSYTATITTVLDILKASPISVTCHTESAGEWSPGDKPSEIARKGGHGFFCLLLLFVLYFCLLLFVVFCFGLSGFCFLTSPSLSFLSESVHVCAASCTQTCMHARGQSTVLGVVHVSSTLQ